MTISTSRFARSASWTNAGRRSLSVLIWLVMVVLLTACAGPLKQWGAETSLVAKAPSFSSAQLENEPTRC
jgi:hypothetical protein